MNVNDMTKRIESELLKYSDEYAEKIKEYTQKVAEECVEEIKRDSPRSKIKGRKKYSEGWTFIKAFENKFSIRYKVKNKNKPQLTHLLEYGHALVNGGRVNAKPHIRKAEENAKKNLLKLIKGE